MMQFRSYQRAAVRTDQSRRSEKRVTDAKTAKRSEVIPLLGLVGEVGSLVGEYKKLLRDGATHRAFKDEVAEELGDILWYVANVATKFDLNLENIASRNLTKVANRYLVSTRHRRLPDSDFTRDQRLPRQFEYEFRHRTVDGQRRLVLLDRGSGREVGDSLTDNTYEDSGYRYHDVMHLTFAAMLGWSPVYRKLLRKCGLVRNRSGRQTAEVEDGGRAQVIEEAIVAAAYAYASKHNRLRGVDALDWKLLRFIQQLTQDLEAGRFSAKDWNDSLLHGFKLWDELRKNGGGVVRGNMLRRTITFAKRG